MNVKTFWLKNRTAYAFLLPWFVGVIVFTAIPMVASLYLSFTNYSFTHNPDWVGFKNYTEMFTEDARLLKSLEITCKYVFIGVPLELLFALFLALLLNRGIRGLSVFRAVYYIPSLLGGSVAIAILWRQVFGSSGIVNHFLAVFGVEGVSWITQPKYALMTLIVLKVWQFGSPMVIFLAGLRQIPAHLYEAARIDGAGNVSILLRITLPLLTPIIFFNLVMQIISSFQTFTGAFVIGDGTGGALDSILFYTLYLYIKAFNHFEMGYASAMAWLLLLIISVFTALLFLTSKKWVHYEE